MGLGKTQLDTDGKRRLRSDGSRIVAEAAPCCCDTPCATEWPTCADDLPTAFTMSGNTLEVGQPDIPWTAALNRTAPCEFAGTIDGVYSDGFSHFTFGVSVFQDFLPNGCIAWRWSGFPGGDTLQTVNDPSTPAGAYNDNLDGAGSVYGGVTGLVIS